MQNKTRLDKFLVEKGYCRSRNQAQELISLGFVEIQNGMLWSVSKKTSTLVTQDTLLRIADNPLQKYVSRAALKLLAALAIHPIDLTNSRVLDVGQSTGGFTQVLLEKGAAEVVGVEVGRDQLAKSLRDDPRVHCLEGVNARDLANVFAAYHSLGSDNIPLARKPLSPEPFELAVMDVSFISQTLIVPETKKLLVPNGKILSLVKPQFESGPSDLAKGGIIKDLRLFDKVKDRIISCYEANDFNVLAYFPSQIRGGDGNHEFFVVAQLAS